MANYEKTGTFTHVDESGNTYELYPQTKAEMVEGLSLFGPVTTGGTGAAYKATVAGITELKVGVKLTIIPHTVSTTYTPTLDVNGLGAKYIRMPGTYNTATMSNIPVESWLVAGKPVTVTWEGEQWETDVHRPTGDSLAGTVPIEKGGTGATTAEGARANLGILEPYVTPEMFGAVGDGITDDTNAFKSAIAACPFGGTLYIPHGTYALSEILVIDKSMHIKGDLSHHGNGEVNDNGTVLKIVADDVIETVFEIKSCTVSLDGFLINANNKANNGILLTAPHSNIIWNLHFANLMIKHCVYNGIYSLDGVVLSRFENVIVSDSANGFFLSGTNEVNTSLHFERCWAYNLTGFGYSLVKGYYCLFSNCACDVAYYGYYLANCDGVSFNGCGCERLQACGFHIETSKATVLNGCFATQTCMDGNSTTSFCESAAGNTTIIACSDVDTNNATCSVSTPWSGTCTVVNCDFTFPTTEYDLGSSNLKFVTGTTGFSIPNDGSYNVFLLVADVMNGTYKRFVAGEYAAGSELVSATEGSFYGGIIVKV